MSPNFLALILLSSLASSAFSRCIRGFSIHCLSERMLVTFDPLIPFLCSGISVCRGDGMLAGVKDAIRRGRMLRCRICGLKGATLGCLKRTCRSSYHLPCAREHGCLLNVEPYAVACPEHVYDLPDGLSAKLGFPKERKPKKPRKQPNPQEETHANPTGGVMAAPMGDGGGREGLHAPPSAPAFLDALGEIAANEMQ